MKIAKIIRTDLRLIITKDTQPKKIKKYPHILVSRDCGAFIEANVGRGQPWPVKIL